MFVLALERSRAAISQPLGVPALIPRIGRSLPQLSAIFPVAMAVGKHPFPCRTRQLSPPAPMVLGGSLPGRVGRRRDFE